MSKRGSLKAIRIGGKSFGFPRLSGKSRHKKKKAFSAKGVVTKSYWKVLVNSTKPQRAKKIKSQKIASKRKSISGLHLDKVDEVKKRKQNRETKRKKAQWES